MNVAIFGATGAIGSRVAVEALGRGHAVTAVVRDETRAQALPPGCSTAVGDVTDAASVAAATAGHDAVVSAVGGVSAEGPPVAVAAARALIAGLPRAGVERLLVVGGAGSLLIAPGLQAVDAPGFPEAWKPASLAQRDALAIYRAEADGLAWTYLSPADVIEPGERTGSYATGGEEMVRDAAGDSRISIEDYAVALVDELERGAHVRARFTVAYA